VTQGADPRSGAELIAAVLIVAVLGMAPIVFGAVIPWTWVAALIGVLLALAVMVGVEWRTGFVAVPWAPVVTWALVALLVTVLQLVPLPTGLVTSISPGAREVADEGWQAISRDQSATLEALLKGVTYLAAGLAAARVARDPRRARAILLLLLALCAFEALYGLVEQVAGEGRILFWSKPVDVVKSRASGTYVNPNHFAGFLAMGIPVALALAATTPGGREVLPRERGAALLLVLTHPDFPKRLLLGFAGVVTAAGLAGSLSKGGLLATVAGCVGVVAVVARTQAGHLRRAVGLASGVGVGVVVAAMGMEAFVERFASLAGETSEPGMAGRLQYNLDTLRMIGAYPVLGIGAGAFEAVFPAFDSANPGRLGVTHAHDDYVQLMAELGILPALALLFGVAVTARRTWSFARAAGGEREALALTALVALVPIAVHSFVDFNLRIPANALWASALLGTAWGVAHPAGVRRVPLSPRWWLRGAFAVVLGASAASIAAAGFLLARADWEARPEIQRSTADERPLPVRVEALARAVEIWPYEARLWGSLASVRWESARLDELDAARATARNLAPDSSDETIEQVALEILRALFVHSEPLKQAADMAEREAQRAVALAPGDGRWRAILDRIQADRPH
jgi:O-antigen ligase